MTGAPHARTGGGDVAPREARLHGRVLMVAAAGYGKTTWVESLAPQDHVAVSATAFAGIAGGHGSPGSPSTPGSPSSPGSPGGARIDESADADALVARAQTALVVEDLHRLGRADQDTLLRRLASVPDDVALILTSREPLSPESAGLVPGPAVQRGPGDLALSEREVARLLHEEHAITDEELPSLLRDATAGWPMLAHLVADEIGRDPGRWRGLAPGDVRAVLDLLGQQPHAVAGWLDQVLAGLGDGPISMLTFLAGLDVVTEDLVMAAAPDPTEPVRACYADLRRMGLLVPHPRWALAGRPYHRVVPLLAGHLTDHLSGRTAGHRQGHDDPWGAEAARRAGAWLERHGPPSAALPVLLAHGRRRRAVELLEQRGEEMLVQGDAPALARLLARDESFPETPRLRLLHAEALVLSGRPRDATALLRRTTTPDAGPAEAAQRDWLVAYAHYACSEPERAATTLDDRSPVPSGGLGVRWLALRATLHWKAGEIGAARRLTDRCLDEAEATGDLGALAHARQMVAKLRCSAEMDSILRTAAEDARSVGDLVLHATILCNRTHALLESARFADAARVGAEAVRACELVGPVDVLIVALNNCGLALGRLGEYDEAQRLLNRAVALSRHLVGARLAFSLVSLADLHRVRGELERARLAYEESLEITRASGERQLQLLGVSGLARATADLRPEAATALAREAAALAPPAFRAQALTALAVATLAAGDRVAAQRSATDAVAAAGERHAPGLLAEALEALAAATDDPAEARRGLREVRSIWQAGGAEPDVCRTDVLLARLPRADQETLDRAGAAIRRLQRLGIGSVGGRPIGEDVTAHDVWVQVLGGFDVVVHGRPVPMKAWKSRQARTLVKMLAAHGGRPVRRERIRDTLWPDEDPARTSHRLSVLLTTVRGVLDPDKSWPSDHYLGTDSRGVWLDLERVSVDAVQLLRQAEHGARLLADGVTQEAATVLAGVDRSFRGGAFEEEPDEDWADALREEVRNAWVRSLRHLATIASQQRRTNDAAALLDRLLRVDPYDERVHRGLVRTLVRAGRHGEARRAFERWTAAMVAVDVPAPDPRVLDPHREATDRRPRVPAGHVLIPR